LSGHRTLVAALNHGFNGGTHAAVGFDFCIRGRHGPRICCLPVSVKALLVSRRAVGYAAVVPSTGGQISSAEITYMVDGKEYFASRLNTRYFCLVGGEAGQKQL
jgi:hypothetical protein